MYRPRHTLIRICTLALVVGLASGCAKPEVLTGIPESLSVTAWTRVDKPIEWGGILGAIQDNGSFERGWLLGYGKDSFYFAVASEGNQRLTYLKSSVAYAPAYWYHVAGTYDGKSQRIYLDGKLAGEAKAQKGPILYAPKGRFVLGAYLDDNKYSDEFVRDHLIPMGAAVWSANPAQMREFPAQSFIRFFHNHGFLQRSERPKWRVIRGGSQRYIEVLTRPFTDRIRRRSPVASIARFPDRVEITAVDRPPERFDEVVIAAHSDQALRMLQDPTPAEGQILGALRYQRNETVLHTDEKLLPRKKLAWASWNYYLPRQRVATPTVTYNMNILQTLRSPRPFCVSLNRESEIDPDRILERMTYHHPVFDLKALDAQDRKPEISGLNRTHYCGAYWGYGFHEDGVVSGLDVGSNFGEEL